MQKNPEASAIIKRISMDRYTNPRVVNVIALLSELHWLLLCFWVQFKVLIWAFKVLQGTGLDYLRDCPSPFTSACPIRSGREDMLVVPFVRQLHLVGPRRQTFSAHLVETSTSRSDISSIPLKSPFHKSLRTWLCYPPGIPRDEVDFVMVNIIRSCLCAFLILIFNCDCYIYLLVLF